MSKVEVVAIEPFNSKRPGEKFELTEREAQQAIDKGLVKMLGPHCNKMRAEPANKGGAQVPPKAAGGATQSSASRAAPASRKTTAKPSGAGASKEPAGE